MGGLTDILLSICAEYFRGLFCSLQGFLVLHKIDNPPVSSIVSLKTRCNLGLEERRQQELEKRSSKPPQTEQINKVSTPKRIIRILWFADVAGAALRFRGQTGQKIPDYARAASDFVHAIIVELVFLFQAMLFFNINLPIISSSLGFVYMALLNSLYSFDYIWMSNGVNLV
uniref:Uncharacterized protein n=1 Tax=Meloidogyne javanica TaxID=6303 RepID=A0A915LI94_MELJA